MPILKFMELKLHLESTTINQKTKGINFISAINIDFDIHNVVYQTQLLVLIKILQA